MQESSTFQIEPSIVGFNERVGRKFIRAFLPDEKSLSERLFLEDLRARIGELFSYLPAVTVRKSYIEPRPIIETIVRTIQKHIDICKKLYQEKDALQREASELKHYAVFLDAMESLLKGVKETPDIDFTGITIKDIKTIGHLRDALASLTGGEFDLLTTTAQDGSIVGLITTGKGEGERIKSLLRDEQVPEFTFPPTFDALTLPDKVKYLKKKISGLSSESESKRKEMESFAGRWAPIYRRVKEWIDDRLYVIRATASAFETRQCLFICGWMPSKDVEKVGRRLNDRFAGEVVLETREMIEKDLDSVPVVLRNPPYFQPFEMFVRQLPLPRYTSFDPTPFIGIFFPVFFGMILGDAGYGLVLIALSLVLMKRFRTKKNIRDASKILFISSVYSVFFGVLYGEFFGDLGYRLFGFGPICVERRTAILPVIYFAVSVGVAHTTLGLSLGLITSLRKREKREALYRLLNILMIFCILALVAALFGIFPDLLTRPFIIAILVLAPLLFFAGGLLSPLELIKSVGNIFSYVRIMAIGLTSVLLAFARP